MPSLREVAAAAGGEVVRDADFALLGFLRHPGPGLCVPLFDARCAADVDRPEVAAVVTLRALAPKVPAHVGLLCVDGPVLEALFRIHLELIRRGAHGFPLPTRIGSGCRVHPRAIVPEFGVVLGDRVTLEPNVILQPGTVLGDDVIVRAGTIIGAEGFEVRTLEGRLQTVPHVGGVDIGARCDIMSNTCIAKALFGGATTIGADCHIDNLVHVAHNVTMGQRCRVVASAMIGGSCVLGDDVWIGPNATVSSSLSLGDGAWVSLGAVVTRDVAAGARVSGNFAIDHDKLLTLLRKVR